MKDDHNWVIIPKINRNDGMAIDEYCINCDLFRYHVINDLENGEPLYRYLSENGWVNKNYISCNERIMKSVLD